MTAGTNFSQSVKAPLWLTNGICKGNIPLVDRGYANGSQIVLVNPDKMWIYEQLTYLLVYISYWIYIYHSVDFQYGNIASFHQFT